MDAKGKPTHPIFVPCGMTSRTPLLEIDYNLHKSNSTYFTDLDISRGALVSRLYSPGVGIISKELDQEFLAASQKAGKGIPRRKPIIIVLGSVYCSFKREIKAFELYEMHSKAIGWDRKWMYILTCFMRPASKPGAPKVLLATALSKYVVKKGRLTIQPERILRASGYLPPRPAGTEAKRGSGDSSDETSGVDSPTNPSSGDEGLTTNAGVDASLVKQVLKVGNGHTPEEQHLANSGSWSAEEWTWERIEQERLRGLAVVDGYMHLDERLHQEWTHA